MTPARFRWGSLLILIGLLLLLRNIDVLNDNFWLDLAVWFPVVLIAIGIEKIFTKTKFQILSYASSVALFGLGLAIAFSGSATGDEGSYFSTSEFGRELDTSVRSISAEVNITDTDLSIRDSGDDIVLAEFDKWTRKPEIDYEVVGDEARVSFTSRGRSYLGGAIKINTGELQDWSVRFSNRIPLFFKCIGENSDIHLNFSTTPLKELWVVADDSQVYIKVGELQPMTKVNITAPESSVRLRVPRTSGLKVLGIEYERLRETIGLRQTADGFVSNDFDSVETRIEVMADEGIQSFSLDRF